MFGISIYPEKSTLKENIDYISLAVKYGFKRLYITTLNIDGSKEEIESLFFEIIQHAKKMGMHVTIDVALRIFNQLNIPYDDLSFFAKLNVNAVRLDNGFDALKASSLTWNIYNLDIEINMNDNTNYLQNFFSLNPNKTKVIGSHNYYPQEFTALEYQYFLKSTSFFKKYNIRTAAHVNSKNGKLGPWPIMDGMCTLEMHRNLDIITQVKHFLMLKNIDDIFIANAFASEQELKLLSELDWQIPSFRVIDYSHNSRLENTIMFDEPHFYRGDVNPYMVRSTQSRVKYKNESILRNITPSYFVKGDIVIGNNDFGQYKGELHLVKMKHPNKGFRKNLIAKIFEEELFLIDLLKPWSRFKFEKMQNN